MSLLVKRHNKGNFVEIGNSIFRPVYLSQQLLSQYLYLVVLINSTYNSKKDKFTTAFYYLFSPLVVLTLLLFEPYFYHINF